MQNYNIKNKDIDVNGYLIEEYPEEFEGDFIFEDGVTLKFLKGVPKKISGVFNCSDIKIKSLIDGPEWVGQRYNCSNTKITSLEGAPQFVGGNIYCYDNKISSLQGIGRKFLKEVNGIIDLHNCPIESHILGLLLVKNLKSIVYFYKNKEIMQIINKHLQSDRDVIECQYELIQNGFKEYAKL